MNHSSIEAQYIQKNDWRHPDICPQAELSIVIGTFLLLSAPETEKKCCKNV
jgi:hypothetical protein